MHKKKPMESKKKTNVSDSISENAGVDFVQKRATLKTKGAAMTTYIVQFVLPCENPEKKVLVVKRRSLWTFEVPINHPDAHNMGFMDLVAAVDLSGLLGLSTHSNTAFSVTKSFTELSNVDKMQSHKVELYKKGLKAGKLLSDYSDGSEQDPLDDRIDTSGKTPIRGS